MSDYEQARQTIQYYKSEVKRLKTQLKKADEQYSKLLRRRDRIRKDLQMKLAKAIHMRMEVERKIDAVKDNLTEFYDALMKKSMAGPPSPYQVLWSITFKHLRDLQKIIEKA